MTTKEILTALALQLQERATAYHTQGSILTVRAGAISGVLDYGTQEMAEEIRREFEEEGWLVVVPEEPLS